MRGSANEWDGMEASRKKRYLTSSFFFAFKDNFINQGMFDASSNKTWTSQLRIVSHITIIMHPRLHFAMQWATLLLDLLVHKIFLTWWSSTWASMSSNKIENGPLDPTLFFRCCTIHLSSLSITKVIHSSGFGYVKCKFHCLCFRSLENFGLLPKWTCPFCF